MASKGSAKISSGRVVDVSIEQATSRYEKWMRSCAPLVASDLRLKHEQMREGLFFPARDLLQVGTGVPRGVPGSGWRS